MWYLSDKHIPEYLLMDGSNPFKIFKSTKIRWRWISICHLPLLIFPRDETSLPSGNFVHLGVWNAGDLHFDGGDRCSTCPTLVFLLRLEPIVINCSTKSTNWGRSTIDSMCNHWYKRFNIPLHWTWLNWLDPNEDTVYTQFSSKGLPSAPSTTTQAGIVLHWCNDSETNQVLRCLL